MRVRQKRMSDLLKQNGFAYGPACRTASDLIFSRPSRVPDLFESIIIGAQGRRGEAVYASVGVAITRRVAYKRLGDVHFIEELGEDALRGWTIIENDRKALQWEARLAEIGPRRATEWANARGPTLLQDTKQVRAAVAEYYKLLDPAETLEQTLAEVKRNNSKQMVEEAEHSLHVPSFAMVPMQHRLIKLRVMSSYLFRIASMERATSAMIRWKTFLFWNELKYSLTGFHNNGAGGKT